MSRKYRKDFYRAKRKLRIPYLIGIRVRALLHSLCPLLSLGIALSSTAIEASYQYGASCALAIVRSVRFRVEKQDEQHNNNKQQTTTTTTTNKQQQTSRCQVPFHPSFPRPVFHHHCPPLPPSFAIAPITSMTVSILRSPYVPFFFDTCHCSLQLSPLTFNVPSNVSIRLLFRTPSARFSFPPRPSKSVYRNYSWPEATKII